LPEKGLTKPAQFRNQIITNLPVTGWKEEFLDCGNQIDTTELGSL